jgi:hypothetical protein
VPPAADFLSRRRALRVRDHAGIAEILQATGHADSWVVRMQHYWSAALARW